jgi:fumarate reductase subunit D
MTKPSNEAFFWMLFSAGGVVAALFIPVQLFVFFIAFPLGWLQGPSHDALLSLVRNPLVRIYLFILCSLPLFHWAHRFRYTLYDGLKVKHLTGLIFVLCYGGAVLGTVIAAYLLWTI